MSRFEWGHVLGFLLGNLVGVLLMFILATMTDNAHRKSLRESDRLTAEAMGQLEVCRIAEDIYRNALQRELKGGK